MKTRNLLVILKKHMAKYKQTNSETGEEEEVEAFTQDELDAKLAEVKTEYDTKIAEKDTSLTTLTSEKAELEKKISGVKEDAPNFKVLKETLDKKSLEIDALKTEVETDKKARKESFTNSLISKVTKGNKEVEDKIKFHIENTLVGMKADTDEDMAKKVDAAIKLSQEVDAPGILDGGMGGEGKGEGFKVGGEGTVEFTAREKALGNKMGITSDDYKKYGPRLKNKI